MATYELKDVLADSTVPAKNTYSLDEVIGKKQSPSYSLGKPSLENLTSNATTFGKGLIGGASDIGNTLINAATYIPRKAGLDSLEAWNQQRQSGLQQFQQANENDPLYAAGRIAGNIAGTAGVGGGAGTLLKSASRTPQAARLAESLATGGLTGANLGYKLAGGAASGALGASLIDPESATTGAAIGGAIPLAGAVAPSVGGTIADIVGGLGTSTGGQPIRTATRAGMQGGKAQETLINNMRGKVPLTDVVDVAEQNLSRLGQQASNAYRSGMVNIKNDRSILDFKGIDKAYQDAQSKVLYRGQVKNEKGAQVLSNIYDEISNWKNLEPSMYHTPEGLDALKQKIGGIVESIPFEEKTARSVGSGIYNSIKSEISQQAPTYSKVMKDYSEGMDEINEIRKTLSVGGKATTDTKLRKLQSVMRNNVNTNYGQREKLVNQLERGGGDITNAVAGQALNELTPRGLGKVVAGGAGLASIANPALLPGLLATSPRLVGEAALKAGQAARYVRDATGKLVPAVGAMSGLLNR
jgi:hypothetical protein